MTFRAKIFLYGSIFLLFLIGLILALIMRSPKTTDINTTNTEPTATTQSTPLPIVTPAPVSIKSITPAEVKTANQETSIQTRAKNFVERFGSYSAEANFSNFAEIKPWATSETAQWLDEYPNQLKQQQGSDFVGVTTRVLSQKTINSTESTASVLASTQRVETRTGGSQIIYRDIIVKMVLADGVWLVDGVFWQ